MKVYLDNAQSGGPKISVVNDDGIVVTNIHVGPYSLIPDPEVEHGFKHPSEFPARDRILIATDE